MEEACQTLDDFYEWENGEMVAKLAEIAIVVSLLTLSQRLIGYENKPLGFLLLAVALAAAIYWLWEQFGNASNKPEVDASVENRTISWSRTGWTVLAGAILVSFVAYPWLAKSRAHANVPVIPQSSQAQAAENKPNVDSTHRESQRFAYSACRGGLWRRGFC